MHKSIKKLYTNNFDLYQKIFMNLLHYDQGVQAVLKENITIKKNQAILDAGTGTGIVIQAMYKNLSKDIYHTLSIKAFDITSEMLTVFDQWIQAKQIRNIKLIQTDVLTIDKLFGNESCHFVLSSGMLEYVAKEDFSKAIQLLHKKLKKKGKFVLFIARKNVFTFLLIKFWWKANTYTTREIRTVLEKQFAHITFLKFPKPYNYLNAGMCIVLAEK